MKSRLLVLALFICYAASVSYTNNIQLNPSYQLSWDVMGEKIYLKLEVQTIGWIGFGLGEPTSGSMPGADILTAIVHSDGTTTIADRYATAKAQPMEDDCADWELVSGKEVNGTTIVEVMRKLVTNDTQDRPFYPGNMKIIFAFGETDTFGYHGSNRFFTAVTFIPGANVTSPDNSTWLSAEFAEAFEIPATTTTYACTTYVLPEVATDNHVVKMELILDDVTKAHVHHMLVFRCESNDSNWFQTRLNNPHVCWTAQDNDSAPCYEVLWGWAHGVGPFVLPENIGFRMGPSAAAFRYLEIQMHYDNPDSLAGMVDHSGLRMYYTPELRQYDAGVIIMGDPQTAGAPLPPGIPKIEYEYNCPESCTSQWPHDINVFESLLHMHQTGAMAWSHHWRNTTDLGYMNRIEYYDFGFQSLVPIERVIKPGDRIQTHCVWDTTTRTNYTYFGQPSDWEMCMDFVFYYPRIPDISFCGFVRDETRNYTLCGLNAIDEFNPTTTDPYGGINAAFGVQPTVCQSSTTGTTSTTTTGNSSSSLFPAIVFTFLFIVLCI